MRTAEAPLSSPGASRKVRPLLAGILAGTVGLGVGIGLSVAGRRRQSLAAPPAEPLPGRPRLVGVLGGQVAQADFALPPEVVLHEGRHVLGRARDAEVRLCDPTVSPRHALVEADREGRVHLRDLGSLNGVAVDGIPVAHVELHDGNRLQLGSVQLVYRTDPVGDDGGRHGGELGEQVGSG